MNESPPETVPPPEPRKRDWASYSALIATLVGLLALCVSAYTAMLQQQQVRAQVWPRLQLMSSGSLQEVLVMNKGVGPAVIESVRVTVDGVPQRDWKMLEQTLGVTPAEYVQSTVNGTVISGGERYVMANFPDRLVWERIRPKLRQLQRRFCYCSTLDECWVVETTQAGANEYQSAARCERSATDEFND
ncbi:hypothetical protein DFR29_10197 [Tahibacter aquaticus]|uniref:Uncharacterized protein n=1 Tax=Tahibacter aquaticus TaxID=520092 RepID=A0A4R6Z993_9GAMM|nr:hypothetical protein [Tahibacter aquaticus]TDR48477.1 hypothetical protein DFR29_10197 [Tahibacter aquaticus]